MPYIMLANWTPAEDMDNHDQGRPAAALQAATHNEESTGRRPLVNFEPWTVEPGVPRDVVSSVGDAGSMCPE